jgi:hypothetical protein
MSMFIATESFTTTLAVPLKLVDTALLPPPDPPARSEGADPCGGSEYVGDDATEFSRVRVDRLPAVPFPLADAVVTAVPAKSNSLHVALVKVLPIAAMLPVCWTFAELPTVAPPVAPVLAAPPLAVLATVAMLDRRDTLVAPGPGI